MADKKIVDLGTGVALGANDSIVLVQGNETLKISGQDVAWGVKTIADLADKSYVDSVAAGGTGEALEQIRNELDQVKLDVAEKLPANNFGLEFWSQLANVTTYHIREDSNLYWTQQRFDDAFANKSTSNLTEGSNLYFTNTRGRSSVFDSRDIITFQNGGEVGNAQYQHMGSPFLGMDIYSPASHDWVQLNYDDRNYVWVTDSFAGIDITGSNGSVVNWLFDENGVLTLPAGGDIVDNYGNSVLGGSTGATALSQLSDVYITSPTSGQVLKFNGTKWVNGTDSTGSGGGGSIGDDPTFNSVTTSTLNVKDINFTGTGPVNIYSSNDVNISAIGRIALNGSELAEVAFSGDFNDLINKPTGSGGSVSWGDITGKPSFATVATSGSYADLVNKPTTPTYDTVTILEAVLLPNHAATKAYVDSQVNDITSPAWNTIVNISNEFGPTRIALGRNAGGTTDADGYGGYGGYGAYGGSSYAIAIGNSSGQVNQGGAAVSIGVASGFSNQGDSAIAIGLTAGNVYQGAGAVAIGESAGNSDQGANAVAIGNTAGYTSQGINAIAIGKNAGKTNQPAGSIVISATGNELNGSAAGLYIDPIRSATATDYVAYYNPTTKEVTYGPAPSGGSSVGDNPTFDSVTTTDLNVQNVTFTGTGAVTITSGNDLNLVAAGNIQINGETFATVATSGSYNDLTNTPYLPNRKTLPPTSSVGTIGDKAGDWAIDESYLYYCHSDYSLNLTTISFINEQKPSSQASSLLGKESGVTEEDFQSWIRMLNPTVGQWKFSFPTVTSATIENIPVQAVTLIRANGNNNNRQIIIQFDGNLVNNLPGYNYQLLWNKECVLTGRASIWRRIDLYGSNW